MLTKNWNKIIAAGILTLALNALVCAEEAKAQPAVQKGATAVNTNKIPLREEADTTDALAIPSDSTEEEIDEEMEELKDLQTPKK